METSLPTFLLFFHSLFTFSSFRKFIRLVVPPNGLWQNHIMTRTHSFIGFFTASYYLTNYTITHLTSSRALMSHSTYSSVLLLTYFLGLILLKGVVYINIQLEGQEDIRNKEKSSSSCSPSRKALLLRGHAAVTELGKKSASLTRWPRLICMVV